MRYPSTKAYIAILAFFALSISTNVKAQILELPPEIAEEAKRSFDEGVNAFLIFTSGNAVSSGAFTFDSNANEDQDTKLKVFSLPISHTFGDEGDAVRFHVEGLLGNAKITKSIPIMSIPGVEVTGAPDFSRVETWSGSVGFGADILLGNGFSFRPTMQVAFSHIRREYDYNNDLSNLLQLLFNIDRNVLNTSSEVMTYAPGARLAYTRTFNSVKFNAHVRYLHMWNDQIWSKSSILDVKEDSGLMQTKLEVDIPLGYSVEDIALGIHPFATRSDIYGAARSALPFNYFHEIGADLTFDTSKHSNLISAAKLGTSYSFADNFSGWRIGFSAEF